VLLDQSKVTVNQLIHEMSEGNTLSFQIASTEPITTVGDALKVAKKVSDGNKISMIYSFKQNSPRMPLM